MKAHLKSQPSAYLGVKLGHYSEGKDGENRRSHRSDSVINMATNSSYDFFSVTELPINGTNFGLQFRIIAPNDVFVKAIW